MPVVTRRGTCRLCGSRDLERVLKLAPTPIGDACVAADRVDEPQDTYPLDLFLCMGCGLAQLIDVIDPDILYRDFWYETSISLGLVDHFERYAEEVLRRLAPADGSMVVDIGSNDGTLLKAFQDRGMKALGIEPSREIAATATKSGYETLPEFFTADLARKIRDQRGPAAIVTANNVFANIDQPGEVVEGIRELLANDGVFVLETGYALDLVQKGLFDNIYHEHLSYFSVKPLERFFDRLGMELVSIERVPTKGGSLRAFVQLAGGPLSRSPSVEEHLGLEATGRLHRPASFIAMGDKIDAARDALAGLLSDLDTGGKAIAGYGASVGATTLTYHFGLGEQLDFLVDDDELKQGLFSPGYHLPILSPDALYERRPDYVVILAWRYAEPITARHSRFLEGGGHLVIPLPELIVR